MNNINEEIEALFKGVTDESKKKELFQKFLKEKSEAYALKVKKLSLEELDNIAGGKPIGDTYGDCEEEKSRCTSLGIGVDICNTFVC